MKLIKGRLFPAGVHVRLERGHPCRRPHAHEKSLLRRRLPQQPRHPVRLPRHEGQPAVALQEGTTTTTTKNSCKQNDFKAA